MEGMADILPPAPAHDGLAALLAPSTSSIALWLLFFLLLLLLVSAVLLRRHLSANWRLWQATRALHSRRPTPAIVTLIERGLRQHHQINILHPKQAPCGVDAAAWQGLIDQLHAARFGHQTLATGELRALLRPCFTPPHAEPGVQSSEMS